MTQLLRKYGKAIAFVVVAIAAAAAIYISAQNAAEQAANTLYGVQLKLCYRGNALRGTVNSQIINQNSVIANALQQFASDAAATRAAEYRRTHSSLDQHATQRYSSVAHTLQGFHYEHVDLLNCNRVIKRP